MAKKKESKELPWEDAILKVLEKADGALHYSEIAERVSSQGLRSQVGANPAANVNAVLSRIVRDGNFPVQRVGKGEYALITPNRNEVASGIEDPDAPQDSETGALRAFGMFWQRDQVVWSGKPKLFGRQQIGASVVNFSEQVGVYLLHDRDRAIYVGRASDNLFSRLRAHTSDRLGGRWDRFSWFGLRSVDTDGSLTEPSAAWTHHVVIETLEALLIESLEPPLNRKRGDNFSGVEYLQVSDPDIEAIRKKQLITELARQVGVTI